MLVIIGKTASGKDSIVKKLCKNGYKKVLTYTTRPQRPDEINGITYNFINVEEFQQKISEGFFDEYKEYQTVNGKWYYGCSVKDSICDNKAVIILTPQGYLDVICKYGYKNIKAIYIKSSNATLKKRLCLRGDDKQEAKRRLKHDNKDFKNVEKIVDKVIVNDFDTDINDVVIEIQKFLDESENI